MALDDQVRARLRALGEANEGSLDEGARARIAHRVAEEGPRALRRARRQRAAAVYGGAVVTLCATAWIALEVRGVEPAPQQLVLQAPQAPQTQLAPVAVATQSPCARRGAIAPQWSARANGAALIDLGPVGAVAVGPGAGVWMNTDDPCRLNVRLERGRIDVRAADLGGGELRITTSSGDVRVHGTRFAVQSTPGLMAVEVDEGRVSVHRRDGGVIAFVAAAERLVVTPDGTAATEPLGDAARAEIRNAFVPSAPPVATATDVQPPAPSTLVREQGARAASASPTAAQLVAEADALWRSGERDRARDRYRKAGAQSGPTAEAAWLALARRELSVRAPAEAAAAITAYETRFPAGELAGEAAGIAFRAAVQQGDQALVRRRAELLQRRHPNTPQAEAAERWLQAHPAQGPR